MTVGKNFIDLALGFLIAKPVNFLVTVGIVVPEILVTYTVVNLVNHSFTPYIVCDCVSEALTTM